jgi:8-hydroxy-5-deazaflavin:NADPH oxidoreductase
MLTRGSNPNRKKIMNIGIIGSGAVAKSLGEGFIKHGHAVMLGSRDPAKLAAWASKNKGAKTGSSQDAARFGEVVVLAVKGTAALEALEDAGGDALAAKAVIDTTNPIADAPPVNAVLKYFTSLDDSLMERLQKTHPKANFVKCFNSVGNGQMVNPSYPGGKPTMFICGNDDKAKQTVKGILDQFGWETADMGTVEAARAIEPLAMLWCIPGFLRNEWTHAFKVVHTAAPE